MTFVVNSCHFVRGGFVETTKLSLCFQAGFVMNSCHLVWVGFMVNSCHFVQAGILGAITANCR